MSDNEPGQADVIPLFGQRLQQPARPRLRKQRRREPAGYRVRVDLHDSVPRIWRSLELRSDASLETVHNAVQGVFGWLNYHLYRFAIGGGPFDRDSELFLCEFDVQEGEDEGAPIQQVRLDETLGEPGDVLHYVYDYGDSWELTLTLEDVRPLDGDASSAVCVDGARAAPPEDCGGLRDAERLSEVLDDPAHFDLGTANEALRGPRFRLQESDLDPNLVRILSRYAATESWWAEVVEGLLATAEQPSAEEKKAALGAHLWFLERAADGIDLTASGYLKPAFVKEAVGVVPAVADWIGAKTRESDTIPLLDLRESLQSVGLLRKYKGRLLLTKAAVAVRGDVDRLWHHLVERLAPQPEGYPSQAAMLELAGVAGAHESVQPQEIAAALTELGWRRSDGAPVAIVDLHFKGNPLDVLRHVNAEPVRGLARLSYSRTAAALAREALRVGS